MTDDPYKHLNIGRPAIFPQDLFHERWLVVWDGRALHAKAGITEADLDAMLERVDALRRVMRQKKIMVIEPPPGLLTP